MTLELQGHHNPTVDDTDIPTIDIFEHAIEQHLPEKHNVEPWSEAILPTGYVLNRSGLYALDDEGKSKRIAGPVWVTAISRNSAGDTGWSLIVRWLDLDGGLHERAFPLGRFHEMHNSIAIELADGGLNIVVGKELVSYLKKSDASTRRRECASRSGWYDTRSGELVYVLPNQIFSGVSKSDVIFQPTERYSPSVETIKTAGTLALWKLEVGEPCANLTYPMFLLCAAFVGPLLRFANLDSMGFHLHGASSHGKTTGAQIAGSVWGCGADPAATPEKSFVRKWNSTQNALEGLAAAHNDNLLILDEIGTFNGKDFGKVVYDLIGGQGKAAMDASRNLKQQRSWRLVVLSTGEISCHQKIEENGGTAKTGQMIRMIDIPVSSMIPKTDESHALVTALKKSCATHYGHAGTEFVKQLLQLENNVNLHALTTSGLEESTALLVDKEAPPAITRAAEKFAMVRFAGMLAVEMGILPFTDEQVTECVSSVFTNWEATCAPVRDSERALTAISEFILKHKDSRMKSIISDDKSVRDLAGFYDEVRNLYFFTEEGFREACRGHDPREVKKELNARDFLHTNEGPGRHTVKQKLPGFTDLVRCVAVKGTLLSQD
ncbi:hypothetical protein BH10CYA1_BH10CYA1_55860 [soil metagenome]